MKQTADWRCLPGLSLQRISELRTTAPDLQRAVDQEPAAALRLVCRCYSRSCPLERLASAKPLAKTSLHINFQPGQP